MQKLILLILFICVQYSFAQQKTITGTVTGKSDKVPLAGATVQTKSKTVITDANGKFSIDASPGETITISYVGMKTETVKVVAASQSFSIQLEEGVNDLDQVVVVGYSTEKKKDLKGAVTIVKMSDVLKETNSNLLSSLQGRVAGLDITNDGAPGTGAVVTLRGLSSFNFQTPPLYIIDGAPAYDFNGLSSNDIESIQVLKDASSAAIYGARAAGGVILVTTKKGKSKEAKITIDAFYGTKTRRNKLSMLNAQQFGDVLWQGFKNDGVVPSDPIYGTGATPVIPAFLDAPKNTTPSANTDWQKETYQPASNMALNFGVSKAADKSNFYFGVNYNKEEGLMVKTFYDRFTARMNSSFNVGNCITVGENLSIGNVNGNRENEGRVVEGSLVQLPIIPLKDNLGNWGGPFASLGDYRNPVGDLNRYKDNITREWRTTGNIYTDIQIIKGLTYHGSVSLNLLRSRVKFFSNRYVMGRFSSNDNSLSQIENSTTDLTATHTLTYNWAKNKHDVQVLAGYEWIHNRFSNFNALARSFFVENPDYITIGSGSGTTTAGGGEGEYGLIGQFGKISYSYNNRYLFGASIRRDGSSRFGPSNRYGVFPALSAAWKIIGEDFFTKLNFAKNISDLKLRASWGKNGSDKIPDYNYATLYRADINYGYYDITGSNTNNAVGFIVSSLGNPSTQWEASASTNLGIDLGMFNNRLYISADYYVKKSDHLLYQVQLPSTVGGGARPFVNVGDIKNSGIELQVSYKSKSTKKLNYGFDLSFTSNKNKAVSIGLDGKDKLFPGPHILKQGTSLSDFYGYINDGIFQNAAEVTAAPAQDGKRVGGLRYRDINGDGKIDADDRTNLGSALPKIVLGLNTNVSYGNFDATLFFDSKLGHKIWDNSKIFTDFLGYTANHGTALLNAWSPTNVGSNIPALSNNNANFDKQSSSYFVKKGDYLRLKSITVGYTLPKNILTKVKVASLRLYIQSENVFTITGFKGWDFEPVNGDLGSYGVSGLTYPHSKAVTFGFNVGF